jgi:large subunit ribosomal protein L4e
MAMNLAYPSPASSNRENPCASVATTLAASVVPSLVMARGHKVEIVPELSLLLADSVESVEKTSAAINILKQVGAYAYAEKAKKLSAVPRAKSKYRIAL